jgi:hypothetical protein
MDHVQWIGIAVVLLSMGLVVTMLMSLAWP